MQKAYEIHPSVGLNINQPITTKEIELLADEWHIQILPPSGNIVRTPQIPMSGNIVRTPELMYCFDSNIH